MKKIIYLGFKTTVLMSVGIHLTGCVGDYAPVQIGKDVYTLQKMTRMETYHDASEHCKKMGLTMKILSERKNNNSSQDDLYNTVIDYKCLNSNSAEYQEYTKYEVGSDVSIKVEKKIKHE